MSPQSQCDQLALQCVVRERPTQTRPRGAAVGAWLLLGWDPRLLSGLSKMTRHRKAGYWQGSRRRLLLLPTKAGLQMRVEVWPDTRGLIPALPRPWGGRGRSRPFFPRRAPRGEQRRRAPRTVPHSLPLLSPSPTSHPDWVPPTLWPTPGLRCSLP